MLENTVDVGGLDLVWQNKPELPVANEENRKLEEQLKQKKIKMEKLKVILENNISKGKNIQDHFNDLCQTISFKQQLYRSREHELEMEAHAEKLIERETSRLEQEIGALNNEIGSFNRRRKQREACISEQLAKKEYIKSMIQWDEEALLEHLKKSSQVEKDNLALEKYTGEDDSKINELEMNIQRLSKECYERKNALEDANTEVLIVQTELDRIQEEFRHAYDERNDLINNWEKVINQIQQRNNEVRKLSEHISKLQADEILLKRLLKEQTEHLSIENSRNNELEHQIREKDNYATQLRNEIKKSFEREEDLKAELSTIRNVLHNLLYQKQTTENSVKQLDKQMTQKVEKLEEIKNSNRKLEDDIEALSKETFEADHFSRELERVLQRENDRSLKIQKEVDGLTKHILIYSQEINDLKQKEKFMESNIKNCQAEIRNLSAKVITLDQVRIKQESDMYEVESGLEKIKRRIKKMYGETNEEERRKVEKERSSLLAVLEERQSALNMLTEELKLMMEKINVSVKELETNKKINSDLTEKIQFLDFYISNSQKSVKCCISRKQELLVQECLVRLQMKKFQKMLRNRNSSVASLQRGKLEFESIMKERIEELKHCNGMLEAEIRAEEEEYGVAKRKFYESNDKVMKLQDRYKVILDAMGISEPGENAEITMLIKAENEKRDLQLERDNLISSVLRYEEELSALKNTVWLINTANEQFRQAIYPPGVSMEDGEHLRNTELEAQVLAIQMHGKKTELRTLEESLKAKREKLEQEQNFCNELQDVMRDRDVETESLAKELADLQTKIQRADRSNYRLSLDVRNKSTHPGIEEDIRIHLLREIRRTVSDLLFSAIETEPDVLNRIQELYEQAHVPLPARARSSLSLRSGSMSSFHSRASSESGDSHHSLSARTSRSEPFSPTVVTLQMPD